MGFPSAVRGGVSLSTHFGFSPSECARISSDVASAGRSSLTWNVDFSTRSRSPCDGISIGRPPRPTSSESGLTSIVLMFDSRLTNSLNSSRVWARGGETVVRRKTLRSRSPRPTFRLRIVDEVLKVTNDVLVARASIHTQHKLPHGFQGQLVRHSPEVDVFPRKGRYQPDQTSNEPETLADVPYRRYRCINILSAPTRRNDRARGAATTNSK